MVLTLLIVLLAGSFALIVEGSEGSFWPDKRSWIRIVKGDRVLVLCEKTLNSIGLLVLKVRCCLH
jgi:hypothetical protein